MTKDELRTAVARAMSEQELEDNLVDMLDTFGFFYHHDRPARTVDGHWKNHFRGQNGFPDWLIIGNRTIFVELKTEKGQLRPEQRIWFEHLAYAGAEVYLWRPRDWLDGTIGEILLGAKP